MFILITVAIAILLLLIAIKTKKKAKIEYKTKSKQEEETQERSTEEIIENNNLNEQIQKETSDLLHEKKIRTIGEKGERISNFSTLPITAYGKQLRNVYIPLNDGYTTEADTIVITISGIYVIETKNYKGKIYGEQQQKSWTVFYKENKKHNFYNPIMQNETHIRALREQLPEIKENCFFSIIAFGDLCVLKNVNYEKEKVTIVQHNELNAQFKRLLEENDGILSRGTVNAIFEKLKKFTNVTEEKRQEHINKINRRYQN